MHYFTKADLEPYLNHMLEYVAYAAPAGWAPEKYQMIEYEEITLVQITETVLICEELHEGKTAGGEEFKYTSVLLIPIAQIVQLKIFKEEED